MRPPYLITPEELVVFMRKNRTFRMAWEDMASVMKARDLRGVKKWVFALGWLSCAYYFRAHMLEESAAVAAVIEKEAARQVAEWERKSGLGFFQLPKGE